MRFAVALAVGAAVLKLLVWWFEPKLAFFPVRGVQDTPAAAGLAFRDQRISTEDGETLHAWWLEHPEPRAQVVFWHGNGGNLSLWLDVIVGLRRRGFSVLAADYRGYGDSTGKPSERGLYRDADATLRTFNEALRKPGVPVIYWGRSIGSPVAAYSASRVAPDGVGVGVVLESPFPDVGTAIGGSPMLRLLSVFSSYSFPTSRFLEGYDGPILVLHGDSDSIIPLSAGRAVYERARGTRKTFAVIPGADHNDLHVANPRLYWRAVDDFVATLREPAH